METTKMKTLKDLEILTNAFLNDASEEKGNEMISALADLIAQNTEILCDGIPSPVNPNVTVPSGYYGPDKRFYVHVFTSKKKFDESTASHPMWTHLKPLYEMLAKEKQYGGFSLNHRKNAGTVLITMDDLAGKIE
jgi:hypothetical protein